MTNKILKKDHFAVVTGASKGLGYFFARHLAEKGHNLILVSIPGEHLQMISKAFECRYGVICVSYETDLCYENNIIAFSNWVKSNFKINILINNAGLGGSCSFEASSMGYINTIIQLNIKALTLLTHQLLPALRSQEKAHILNVSSMASFSPIGYKSVYPASKTFVQNFSLGLSEELKKSSVKISVVHPGGMKTNWLTCRRIQQHNNLIQAGVLPADLMARKTLKKMFRGKRVIIVGWANVIMFYLMKVVPFNIRLPMMTNAVKREIELTLESH